MNDLAATFLEANFTGRGPSTAEAPFWAYHTCSDAVGPTVPSGTTNQATRREWRELGFFHGRNDQTRAWKFIGSQSGLLRFRDALLAYVADPGNIEKSEHEHYGPYSYLQIMTWPEPGFDHHAIRGSLSDLKRLAAIVEAKLAEAHAGEVVCIWDEFAANTPYGLILEVREDGFDPAEADPLLPKEFE